MRAEVVPRKPPPTYGSMYEDVRAAKIEDILQQHLPHLSGSADGGCQ